MLHNTGKIGLASHRRCSAFDSAAMFFYSRDTGSEHLASRLHALLP
jgi:hypothetical protein